MTSFPKSLSSFALRNLAMVCMVIDHTGATLFPDMMWLRYIGRLAFPIFAFLIIEGYFHTRNFRNYLLRLLVLAILTDFPFQFMINGNWDYLPFQNVIWTFLIGLIAVRGVDWSRQHVSKHFSIFLNLILIISACMLADFLGTDYHSLGVLTLIGFYYCRGTTASHKWGQLLVLFLINGILANLETFSYIGFENIPLYWNYYGVHLLSPQLYAPIALLFIWLYNGKAGHKSPLSQTFNYLFYPLHMAMLGVIALYFF